MDVHMENDEVLKRSECDEPTRMKRKRPAAASEDSLGEEFDECENVIGVPAPKYREVEQKSTFQLEDFSDEVLLEIFKNLDSRGLLPLMNCCRRFHNLILDRRFWNEIDVSEEPLPLGVLETLLERTHNNTQILKLRGPPPTQHVLTEIRKCRNTLEDTLKNRCTQLQVLELQGIPLDFECIRIVDFPKSLKRLILNDCNVSQPISLKIFCGIDTHLTNLEELGIEYNDWFMPEFLMTFSKAPALRWLSLKGCNQLYEFVPYGSMASRFGFKQLEFLDMRYTPITDSDLQCFNAVVTLKEILLDCPDSLRMLDEKESVPQHIEVSNNVNNASSCQASTSKIVPSNSQNVDDETPSTSSAASTVSRFKGVPPPRSPQWNLTISLKFSNNNNNSNNNNDNNNNDNNNNDNNNNDNNNNDNNNDNNNNNNNNNNNINNSNNNENSTRQPSVASDPNQQSQQQEQVQPQQPSTSTSAQASTLPSVELPSSSSSSSSSSPSSRTSATSASSSSLLAAPPNVQEAAHHAPDVDMLPHRNIPSRSRFLPRPEQVILVDLLNRDHSIVVHGQPRAAPNGNPNNHFDQVLNHPLFWDIINPLAQGSIVRFERTGAGNGNGNDAPNANEAAVNNNPSCRHRHSGCFFHNRRYNRQPYLISDRGICCFGRPDNPVNPGIIWIRLENRPSENSFQRLSVRNYKMVTDISLEHLVQCSPQLVYLDLSGTSVTQAGVQNFKKFKPDCEVIAEHLSMPVEVVN